MNFALKPDSAAVDRRTPLANITDDFTDVRPIWALWTSRSRRLTTVRDRK